MKTKLLKKARKRFTIMHYPKGLKLWGKFQSGNIFCLTDSTTSWNNEMVQIVKNKNEHLYIGNIFTEEKAAINYLKGMIIKILRSEGYGSSKESRALKAVKKVWWVSK